MTQLKTQALLSFYYSIIKKFQLASLIIILQPFIAVSAIAATDPVTSNHPLWSITQGEAIIDGVLSDNEWSNAFTIVRNQAWRDDGQTTIRMMYSQQGIYLSAHVLDENIWADGIGSGNGNRWEVETDDSITFYFDPDNSRDEYFSENDRAFGVNPGNSDNPVNGAGIVRRWKYVHGDGGGNAPDVIPGGKIASGVKYKSIISGTANNSTDKDQGWVTEMFLPWGAVNMNAPSHGQTMGMNFDLIFDNDGGERNFVDNRNSAQRFELPAFVDDHIQGVHSSYTASQAGIRGPVNYAMVQFIESDTATKPAAITNLSISDIAAFGAKIKFSSPAGMVDGKGHAVKYQIRYSTSPIHDETTWSNAIPLNNHYIPKLAGMSEVLRIVGLSPSTSYHIVVRGEDMLEHLADFSNSVSFSTRAKISAQDKGRIVPSPNGLNLQFEGGSTFIPIGDHMGISWAYFRNLYPGDIWDPMNSVFINYNANPSFEGEVGPHMAALAAKGVNTLRVFLETLGLDQSGNSQKPAGRYWIEYPAGNFNPDMKQFVLNALEQAALNDIYLIFSPFDTFSWDENFTEETPWYVGNGGPLNDINNFFQTPATLTMAKLRLKTIMGWVNESPYKNHLIGWESLNEWDSYEWTLNAEGNSEAGRETEMRRRVIWMKAINDYVRSEDPEHLVLSSTTARDPRGPVARALYYNDFVDVLAPHFYTNSSEEPINNPDDYREILAAIENARLTAYWRTHINDYRPLINAEWGMTRVDWPGQLPEYSTSYTQVEDEALYRTLSWSALASGQNGSGLRIATDELAANLHNLTDAMRDIQLSISKFVQSDSLLFDFTDFAGETLQNLIVNSNVHELLSWGISDGEQGLAYVLQNKNKTTGEVNNASLSLSGLKFGQLIDVEYWLTSKSAATPASSQTNLLVTNQPLSLTLPTFSEDIAIKFKAKEQAEALTIDAQNGETTHEGSLGNETDIDILQFSSLDTGRTIISIQGLSSASFDIYDASGNKLGSGSTSSEVSVDVQAGEKYLIVLQSTGTGLYTLTLAAPIANNEFASKLGGHMRAAAFSDGRVALAGFNGDGDVIVTIDDNAHTSWSAYNISELLGSSGAYGILELWIDPKDNILTLAVPTNSGILLYARGSDGSWSQTNLTSSLNGEAITQSVTHFISPDLSRGFDGQLILNEDGDPEYNIPERERNNINIAGLNSNGEVVLYSQRRDTDNGTTYWVFANITKTSLIPTNQPVPVWTGDIIGYTTPWNGHNIAGLNSDGEIIAVWISPGREFWAATNLSQSQGTPQLAGGVSAYTNWGINLTGVLPNGHLGVTWWSPQYEQEQKDKGFTNYWAFSDLTESAAGPTLSPNSVANYTTPNWASNNIAALSADKELVVYWWTPENTAKWFVHNLSQELPRADTPIGKLSSIAPEDSTYSVQGIGVNGDILRYYWSSAGGWIFQNVTDMLSQ